MKASHCSLSKAFDSQQPLVLQTLGQLSWHSIPGGDKVGSLVGGTKGKNRKLKNEGGGLSTLYHGIPTSQAELWL